MTLAVRYKTRPDRGIIALEIAALEVEGRITAEEIVRVAEDPASPLHGCFTWDDHAAGHAWRVSQARELIRSVRVEVVTETRTITAVHYVRDPLAQPEAQGYVSLDRLRTEPESAAAALSYELARADAYLSRAEDIAGALGLAPEVTQQRKRLGRLRAQVDALRGGGK